MGASPAGDNLSHDPANGWPLRGILFSLPFILYVQSLGFDLLRYDDGLYYYGNPALQDGTAGGLLKVWTTIYFSDYFPLTQMTLWLDLALFGDASWVGARLHGIAWFGVGVLAVRALVERLTGRPLFAFGVAGLYALHPLCALSTLWLAERKQVLCLAAVFWCLERYIAARETPEAKRAYLRGAAAFALGIAALLTKAHGVVVPVLLAVYEGYRWLRTPPEKRRFWIGAAWLAPHVIATALFLFVNLAYFRSDLNMQHLAGDRLSALGSSGLIVWRYLRHTLMPWDLSFFYAVDEWPATSPWGWLGWGLVFTFLATAAWCARGPAPETHSNAREEAAFVTAHQPPHVLAALALALGLAALAPAVNVMPQSLPMMDHYAQWALPGWLIGLALAFEGLLTRAPSASRARIARAAVIAAMLGCASLSWLRVPLFADVRVLFADAVARQPASALARGNYANRMIHSDEADERARGGEASLAALRTPDAYRIPTELREQLIVEAAVTLHAEGRHDEANALVEEEMKFLMAGWEDVKPLIRAQVALRTDQPARATELLAECWTEVHRRAAERLRAQCRSGQAAPYALPKTMKVETDTSDAYAVDLAAFVHQRKLLYLARARLRSGDLEGGWNAAAVLTNQMRAYEEGYEVLAEAWERLGRKDLAGEARAARDRMLSGETE